jgi:hypothetical protein
MLNHLDFFWGFQVDFIMTPSQTRKNKKRISFGCQWCGMSKIPTYSFETNSYILKRINKNAFFGFSNLF